MDYFQKFIRNEFFTGYKLLIIAITALNSLKNCLNCRKHLENNKIINAKLKSISTQLNNLLKDINKHLEIDD